MTVCVGSGRRIKKGKGLLQVFQNVEMTKNKRKRKLILVVAAIPQVQKKEEGKSFKKAHRLKPFY
uniref:Uncharacterized protein n=1 Tax=Octopus bimaculoides TaxID=37653 RepID=A0A0L8FVJ0_OCTBM